MLVYCSLEFERLGPLAASKIDFKPFTVLVGPNGSGKSYVGHCIGVLDGMLTQALPWFGELVPVAEERRSESGGRRLVFRQSDTLGFLDKTFQRGLRQYFRFSGLRAEKVSVRFPTTKIDSETVVEVSWTEADPTGGIREPSPGGFFHVQVLGGAASTWSRGTLENFLQYWGRTPEGVKLDTELWAASMHCVFHLLRPMTSDVAPVFYLPASRSGLMCVWRLLVDKALQGYFGAPLSVPGMRESDGTSEATPLTQATTDFVRRLASYEPSKRGRLDSIAGYLEEKLLHGQCTGERKNGSPPEFGFIPFGLETRLPLHVTSSGTSEVFPLVLFLRHIVAMEERGGPPRGVLILEEPEAHLHLAAQRVLAQALVMVLNAGVKVIVTTHSDVFVQELNTLAKAWRVRQAGGTAANLQECGISSEQLLNPELVSAYCLREQAEGFVAEKLELEEGGIPVPPMLTVIDDQARLSAKLNGLLGTSAADD